MMSSKFAGLVLAACVLSLSNHADSQCFGKQVQSFPRIFPWQMISADFNHDGIPDLASATPNSETPSYRGVITVFLGDGKGTFQTPRFHYYEGHGVMGLAAGDFDNDGNLDIIDVNSDLYDRAEGAAVLLGDGDGTFSRHVHNEARYSLTDVAVGDFNADGNVDAVVSSWREPFVGVLVGRGDGTLLGPNRIPTNIASPWRILTGDLNSDGISDLVLMNTHGVIEVHLSNGDGTFRLGGTYKTTGLGSSAIVQGDFNEDGIIDLAASAPHGVDVFIGNGDGTFQLPVHYGGWGFEAMAAGDTNGDGHPDIFVMKGPSAYFEERGYWGIYLGNGDGTFQPVVKHFTITKPELTISMADFDGDGLADLAFSDGIYISIFPNLGNCP